MDLIQSDKRIIQDLVSLCVKQGIRSVIITPGSRNAPLAISFNEHSDITCLSIADERSAAFFALGLSRASGKPVAICCTSGTALLNYYPAVTEAFYQRIPLLVLSADRPPEKIDQQDGQTIRQASSLNHHVRKSVNLTLDHHDEKWIAYNRRLISEALISLSFPISGPVHINIPLREPLYEVVEKVSGKTNPIALFTSTHHLDQTHWDQLAQIWDSSERVMILLGMDVPDAHKDRACEALKTFGQVVVFSETTSNLAKGGDVHIDRVLGSIAEDEFKGLSPDLIITTGGGLISKRIKQWLRQYSPAQHWHINEGGEIVDTYQVLSAVIDMHPGKFFEALAKKMKPRQSLYKINWAEHEMKAAYRHQEFLKECPFSDLKVFSVLETETQAYEYDLHVGNSSAVRYLQLFDFPQVRYHHCNRGTSGIDGSSSTAAGYAYHTGKLTLLITGDVSFFYDVNAWWNHYLSPQLRILMINNGGGNIFRLIDGPSRGGVLDPFQETPHRLTAEGICRTFNLSYSFVDNELDFKASLTDFFETSERPKLLEVKTPGLENPKIWKSYFNYLTHGNTT